MRSAEDQRKLRLAHELLETPPDDSGFFNLHDGTYYILGTIEGGKSVVRLRRMDEPPA